MTNDALLAAVARRLRGSSIASADKHLVTLAGVRVYRPGDLR